MRNLFSALVLLLTLFMAPEQAQAQDRFNFQCRTDPGPITEGCVVTVYDAGTLDLADIFTDTGLSTPKANPFTAATNGQLFFYAADGNYDIVLTNGDPDIGTFVLPDIRLGGGGGGGSGTVTSAAMTVPSILSVAGSPITTAGTFALSLATQAANLAFLGPSSGSAAIPTFRALVADDLPDMEALNTQLTDGCVEIDGGSFTSSGTPCATVTSIGLALPGIFTVAGSPVTGSGTITIGLASQTQNQVFASPDGSNGAPGFRALTAPDIPSLDTAKITTGQFASARISEASVLQHEGALTLDNLLGPLAPTKGGTGLTTYTVGDLLYSAVANTLAKLGGNTTATKMFLSQTGNGTASAAPVWEAIDPSDLAASDTQTFGTGAASSVVHTYDITAGTDPVWTYTSGFASLTTGVLRQGSTPVVLQTREINTTSPLTGGGALSSNLTLTISPNGINAALIDETDNYVWTGDHSFEDGTLRLPEFDIGDLPAASTVTGRVYIALDGADAFDCTTGLGSTPVLCRSNGSIWVPVSSQAPADQPDITKQFVAAMCQGADAASAFNRAETNFPAATCVTGSNTIYATLAFDPDTDELVQDRFTLPAQMPTTISLTVVWRTSATTGDVVWALETVCVATGESGDPSWNAAQTITASAPGTTLLWASDPFASLTLTGCAAGEEFLWRFRRDADNGADDLTADAQLIHLNFLLDLPAQP